MDSSPNRLTNYQTQERKPPVASYLDGTCPSTTTMPRMDMALFKEAFICEICVEFYTIPYTLECGHTFCSECILNWFKRQKTCPHCRMDIHIRPVPAFAVHNQVNTVRSLLFGHQVTNDARAVRLAQQEFEIIYPNARPLQFIQDEEDNVNRCGACAWELDEEGRCCQCNRSYRGAAYDDPFPSEDSWSHVSEGSDLADFVVYSDHTLEEDEIIAVPPYLTESSDGSPPYTDVQFFGRSPLRLPVVVEPYRFRGPFAFSNDDSATDSDSGSYHSPHGSNIFINLGDDSDSESNSKSPAHIPISSDSEQESDSSATDCINYTDNTSTTSSNSETLGSDTRNSEDESSDDATANSDSSSGTDSDNERLAHQPLCSDSEEGSSEYATASETSSKGNDSHDNSETSDDDDDQLVLPRSRKRTCPNTHDNARRKHARK